LELERGEPIVLKFFSVHDVPALLLDPEPDEEARERLSALRAIWPRTASDHPPACLICDERAAYPALIGYARGALKGEGGAVCVVCEPCFRAADDLRASVLEAVGGEELTTSTLPS
jgi:hypothetical protein